MSVYTRTGDDGFTSHPHYGRISKSSAEINAEGKFDEAIVAVGSTLVELKKNTAFGALSAQVRHAQNRLFAAAFGLYDSNALTNPISEYDIELLERWIDEISSHLPLLHSFVLPGGSEPSIRLHTARVAVRALERACRVCEDSSGPLEPLVTSYLNRLSDFFFVAARYALLLEGLQEDDLE